MTEGISACSRKHEHKWGEKTIHWSKLNLQS